jgi:hypothetical protein
MRNRNRLAIKARKKFRDGKSGYVVLGGAVGDPCPRCGGPTAVREHKEITERELDLVPAILLWVVTAILLWVVISTVMWWII